MKNYSDTKRIIDTVENLIRKYGITDEDLKQDLFLMLLENEKPNDAIHNLISNIEMEEENKNLVENFSDKEIEDPYHFEDEINLKMDVEKLLETLPLIERVLIQTYFGLNGVYGVVTPREEEIVLQSLKKLRDNPRIKEIRYYIFDD